MREYFFNVEDYEEVKIKVADMEEEKEQFLKEKQIIIG